MPKFVGVKRFSLNLGGLLVEYERPAIMAIINATPDSFYSGGRNGDARQIERAIAEGADILDLGGCSTRPGAPKVSAEEEWQRLEPVLRAARQMTNLPISVDTFRSSVARRAIDCGADIINDISGGLMDSEMDALIASTRTPYILMHMGDRESSLTFLARRVGELEALGVKDIIIDPGFGFGKDVEQNYELLGSLKLITDALKRPMLVGVSRKSMFYKPLGLTPEEVLPATCAANLIALQAGAAILRVHDVGAARQICLIAEKTLHLHNV